jgi:hypothetical protein
MELKDRSQMISIESLRSDKSIPGDIYNDDLKLFHHFSISFVIPAGPRPWERRQLAETPAGYFAQFPFQVRLPSRHPRSTLQATLSPYMDFCDWS